MDVMFWVNNLPSEYLPEHSMRISNIVNIYSTFSISYIWLLKTAGLRLPQIQKKLKSLVHWEGTVIRGEVLNICVYGCNICRST